MLELFWSFFTIGAVSFGGGYAMVPLFIDVIVGHGWMAESAVLDFIAVSYSTPGPFSVNLATFVGATLGGAGGAAISTAALALPSFLLMTVIAANYKRLKTNRLIGYILEALRAMSIALIAVAALKALTSAMSLPEGGIDYTSLGIFAVAGAIQLIFKKIHPIALILIGCSLGIVFFGIL